MEAENKIQALIQLLDDPDRQVYESVSRSILDFGPDVIPELEKAWEFALNEFQQQRIENLIQEIQRANFRQSLDIWRKSKHPDLLEGTYLIAKFQYPELSFERIEMEIETISKDVWLELNENLTALEKTRILNYILFDTYKFSGNYSNFFAPQNNFLNNVLETRRGNPESLGIIYSIIGQRLGLPIYGVNLPKNFVLAYVDEPVSVPSDPKHMRDPNVLFYINPFRKGSVLNRTDIEYFIKSQNIPARTDFLQPCSHQAIIERIIKNLIYAYGKAGNKEKTEQFKNLLILFQA